MEWPGYKSAFLWTEEQGSESDLVIRDSHSYLIVLGLAHPHFERAGFLVFILLAFLFYFLLSLPLFSL